jgi:hypothetical protein
VSYTALVQNIHVFATIKAAHCFFNGLDPANVDLHSGSSDPTMHSKFMKEDTTTDIRGRQKTACFW